MKNILRLISGSFAAAFFALAAQAADLAPGAFSAGTVQGDVSYKLAGSTEYKPLSAGVALPQGATIKTGAKSSLVVVFGSGSTAAIDESSEIEITKFEQEVFSGPVAVGAEPSVSKTQIKLIEGDVTAKVAKLKKGSSFTVDTPVGAAGVRGTTFKVSWRKGNTTFSIVVTDGSVVFTKTKSVKASGESSNAKGEDKDKDSETLIEAGKKVEVEVTTAPDGTPEPVTINLKALSREDKAAVLEALGAIGESGKGDVTISKGTVVITPTVDTSISPN